MARASIQPTEPAATRAAALVASEAAAGGGITFARFMELALYAPGVGYYEGAAADRFGRDYITSAEIHPCFGALLCGQFEEMWRSLGRPNPFWLVEGGPGTGVFAGDVLATAEEAFPEFAAALHVALAERSAALRSIQVQTLSRWTDQVRWIDIAEGTPLGAGCVFANELLDALPVHRVVMREGGLREIFVGSAGANLYEIERFPSAPMLERQITFGGGKLRVDDRGEVNLAAGAWLQSGAKLIERGYVVLLDYGEPAQRLYGERHPHGTLRCYFEQTVNVDVYRRVGLQDITAHVDLSAVTRAGEAAGLHLLGATHQGPLLDRLGIDAARQMAVDTSKARVERRAQEAAFDLLRSPSQLGRIAVLGFGKNAPTTRLTGFTEGARFDLPPRGRMLSPRLTDPAALIRSLRR